MLTRPVHASACRALQDWGNDSPGQYATAKGMGVVAKEIDAHHVFCLGDNFYVRQPRHPSAPVKPYGTAVYLMTRTLTRVPFLPMHGPALRQVRLPRWLRYLQRQC